MIRMVTVLLVLSLAVFAQLQPPPATIYACPHHPHIHSDKPGKCTICGMDLEPQAAAAAPVPTGKGLTLAALEKLALERNPRLGAAKASIDMAAGNELQSGLYPNPSFGATGDHLSPNAGGGAVGGFFEQRIVTAGKLSLARKAAGQMTLESKEAAELERLRVLTELRMLFFDALGQQELVATRQALSTNARKTAAIARELANLGQADTPDILAADNEAERVELELESARHSLRRAMAQLAAAVNTPALEGPLAGDLAALPHPVDPAEAASRIASASPEARAAQLEIARTAFAIRKARIERIPDIVFRGGVRNNRELLNNGVHIGTEGIFDASVELPIFNRNQGAIAAAKADAERARYTAERVQLDLRARLAAVLATYDDARLAAERYKTRIIPQAEKAVELYSESFRRMATAYPSLLTAERNLAQHREAYVMALIKAQTAAVEIEGLVSTVHR